MAISWTYICNLSLAKLGARSISNIDTDTTENAVKCRAIYENTRDALLRSHDWNFAIERAELAQLSTTPEYGFDYEYTLPTSPYCLRVIEMETGYFEIEGRKLLTDEPECKIKYIARIVNPTKLDNLFINVMACSMASQLAISITNSGTMKDRMDKEFVAAKLEASMIDAYEGTKEDLDESESDLWVEAGR
jgi:hypothetical protein